ncbi:FMN-binding protein [Oenococcus kitaharae]|uniref:FMN-binding protein n=1 Tax=Oenococcus TaxID=46254 RepID=UPI0021E95B1B|nr:FMN-binding protein [Oenococcus kitaharae]MCV3295733.1 FMN-binding protein [Oenococcus kitaharae]
MLKKLTAFIISIILAVAIAIDGYLLFFKKADPRTVTTQANTNSQAVPASSSSVSSSSGSSTVPSSSGAYRDGSYTGSAVRIRWGRVRVRVLIKNGKIASVSTLEYPNTNPHDQRVSQIALPTYESESVQANSSKIQAVSGATETWQGFTKSLQNALNQSKG